MMIQMSPTRRVFARRQTRIKADFPGVTCSKHTHTQQTKPSMGQDPDPQSSLLEIAFGLEVGKVVATRRRRTNCVLRDLSRQKRPYKSLQISNRI